MALLWSQPSQSLFCPTNSSDLYITKIAANPHIWEAESLYFCIKNDQGLSEYFWMNYMQKINEIIKVLGAAVKKKILK